MYIRLVTLFLAVTQLFSFTLGTAIKITDAPWQASVMVHDKHRCGGVIYSRYVVLTTAGCVKKPILHNFSVRVGSDKKDQGGQVIPVDRVILQFVGERSSDVAILALKQPIDLGDNVKTIELASRLPKWNTKASVTGWAEVAGEDPAKQILMRTNLTIVKESECMENGYLIKRVVNVDELCASKSNSTNVICQGFSGGPLVSDGKLIGIGSWQPKCDFLQSPSIFSNIPMIKLWITTSINLLQYLPH